MSSATEILHLVPTRRATYHKSRKGAFRSLNWPHPLTKAAAATSTIHADHLSVAGFHSTPTSDYPGTTTCFLCDVVIAEWNEGDQPDVIHLQHSPQCAWAILRNTMSDNPEKVRKEFNWGIDGQDWPRSDKMQRARIMSFERGWPHKRVKKIPTVDELASAGWWFRPEADEEAGDRCFCPYCTRTVEGWEAGDDPVALHRRKLGLECPFFLADKPVLLAKTPAPAPAASTSSTRASGMSRSKGRSKLAAIEADGELNPEDAQSEAAAPSRASRRGKATPSVSAPPSEPDVPNTRASRSSTATAASTRSTRSRKNTVSRSTRTTNVVEEVEEKVLEEEDPDEGPTIEISRLMSPSVRVEVAVKTSKRPTRGAKKAAVVEEVEVEPASEIDVEKEDVLEDANEEVAAVPGVEPEVVDEEDEEEEDEIVVVEVPKKAKAKKGSKKASRSSKKSKDKELELGGRDAIDVDEGGQVVRMAEREDTQRQPESEMEEAPAHVPIVVEEPEKEPEDLGEPKVKSKKSSKSKSKSKHASSSKNGKGPLTPIVIAADPAPRPPSPLPALAKPYVTREDHAFALDAPLYPLVNGPARSMTLEEWYDACGKSAYSALEAEMSKEMEDFERRIADGRKMIQEMIASAKRREASDTSSGAIRSIR